jgi:predicted HAD superfamily phosphohydrolase YqeG
MDEMNAEAERPFYIYVDVDDTFVRSAGTKRMPMPSVIQHIRELKEQGAILYCWSSGGAEYARQSAEEFGVADCFVGFLPKPNVLLDDQCFSEWRYLKSVHPTACPGQTLEDYKQK